MSVEEVSEQKIWITTGRYMILPNHEKLILKKKKIFQSPTSLRYVPGVALVVLTKGPLPS